MLQTMFKNDGVAKAGSVILILAIWVGLISLPGLINPSRVASYAVTTPTASSLGQGASADKAQHRRADLSTLPRQKDQAADELISGVW